MEIEVKRLAISISVTKIMNTSSPQIDSLCTDG